MTKLSDGRGLQLWIYSDGARRWLLDYHFGRRRKSLSLGTYPAVSLVEARDAVDGFRKALRDGKDPADLRREQRLEAQSDTFAALAKELIEKKRKEGVGEGRLGNVEYFNKLACKGPDGLGKMRVRDIRASHAKSVVKRVEDRGAYSVAQKVKGWIGEVMRYAMEDDRALGDPTAPLKRTLVNKQSKRRPAATTVESFGKVLKVVSAIPDKRHAIGQLLLALTAARPGELRQAVWSEFGGINWNAALRTDALGNKPAAWEIAASKMKMKQDHAVPLSPMAVSHLRQLREINTALGYGVGGDDYLFPATHGGSRGKASGAGGGKANKAKGPKPANKSFFSKKLAALGFRNVHCAHGYRSSFSTLANKARGEDGRKLWDADWIEAALAHEISGGGGNGGGGSRRHYLRETYFEEGVPLMDWWADRVAEWLAQRDGL